MNLSRHKGVSGINYVKVKRKGSYILFSSQVGVMDSPYDDEVKWWK